jgi:hypothetical protein
MQDLVEDLEDRVEALEEDVEQLCDLAMDLAEMGPGDGLEPAQRVRMGLTMAMIAQGYAPDVIEDAVPSLGDMVMGTGEVEPEESEGGEGAPAVVWQMHGWPFGQGPQKAQ